MKKILILCLFTTYGLFGATSTSPLDNSHQPHCNKEVTERFLVVPSQETANAQPVKKPISLLKVTLFFALYYAAYKASGEIKDLGTTNDWPLVPTIFGITETYTGFLALLSGIALPLNVYDKIHQLINKKID